MDVKCDDPLMIEWGNLQYEFIKETMEEWDKDENIIWKMTV